MKESLGPRLCSSVISSPKAITSRAPRTCLSARVHAKSPELKSPGCTCSSQGRENAVGGKDWYRIGAPLLRPSNFPSEELFTTHDPASDVLVWFVSPLSPRWIDGGVDYNHPEPLIAVLPSDPPVHETVPCRAIPPPEVRIRARLRTRTCCEWVLMSDGGALHSRLLNRL